MPETTPGYDAALAAAEHHATIRDQHYVDTLAGQLHQRHPDLLARAENDLALYRARLAIVARFIHNPTYDDTTRRALAQALGLPQPTLTPENTP